MKKLILPICLVVLAAATANAQGFSIGARAGMNIANQSISANGVSSSPSSKVGYLLGGYATFMFTSNIGLQPELFFSSVGSSWPSSITGGTSETIRLNYFTVPVLFRYNVTENFNLLAGPQIGMLASAKSIGGGQTNDIKSDLNSADFSGVIGAGVDFGPINAGLRYNFGLSNIASSSGSFSGATLKNTAFQIVVGYKLFGAGK